MWHFVWLLGHGGRQRHSCLWGIQWYTKPCVGDWAQKKKPKKIWFWLRKAEKMLGHTLFIVFFFLQKCAYTTSIDCFPGGGRGGIPTHPCYRRLVFRTLRHYPIDSRLQAVFQAPGEGLGWTGGELRGLKSFFLDIRLVPKEYEWNKAEFLGASSWTWQMKFEWVGLFGWFLLEFCRVASYWFLYC